MNEQMMSLLMQQAGGPVEFQRNVNNVQNLLSQANMSPEQYVQRLVQSGQISQEKVNWAMQMANNMMGRK
jgi:hypothetical protein